MIAFQRLSQSPTIPELLRQDAEQRAARSFDLLPVVAWCRPATIVVIWHYRNNTAPRAESAHADVRFQAMLHTFEELARAWSAFPGSRPSLCSIQVRFRAVVRLQRAASQVIHIWKYHYSSNVCLANASGLLSVGRALDWCGLLGPSGVGIIMAGSNRLIRAGMRLWRSGRRSIS